jgi:hypothetical protein
VLVGAMQQVLDQPTRPHFVLVSIECRLIAEETLDEVAPNPPGLGSTPWVTRGANDAMQRASQSGRIVSLPA